jgi:hypothetical protein
MMAGGGDTPRVVSLGGLLLDRLRTARTSPASAHRSDQLPPTPSAAELPEAFGAVETGSVVAVERLSFALLAIDRSGIAGLQRRALVELSDMDVDAWLALGSLRSQELVVCTSLVGRAATSALRS